LPSRQPFPQSNYPLSLPTLSHPSGAGPRAHDAYPVRLPIFEGPLALLLHLIRSHKLEIHEIAIAQVTEQYLEYLRLMESLDLDVAGEFLVMAATLMEIKSRMLLPRPESLREEEEGQDPRAELVARLLEYERFQHVAEQLRELAAERSRSFPRGLVEAWEGAVPLVELRPADLLVALRRIVQADEEQNGAGAGTNGRSLRVRRQAVNLRQRVGEVLRRVLAQPNPVSFSSLLTRFTEGWDRVEVLVTFLAVLELVRLGQVTAWQDPDGDIFLQRRPEPAPAATPGAELH